MMTSHVNCILVCNAGEMMEVHPWSTQLLRRMCLEYITPWKDALGVHGSLEGCTWIHSFLEGCVWNRFENVGLKFFMMTSKLHAYM